MAKAPCGDECPIATASMTRIEAQLTLLTAHVTALTVQGAENTLSLKEHIRRTELLERTVLPLKEEFGKAKILSYIVLALASSAGLLGTFGKNILGLFTGAP